MTRRLSFSVSPAVLAVALGLLGPAALLDEDEGYGPEEGAAPQGAPGGTVLGAAAGAADGPSTGAGAAEG